VAIGLLALVGLGVALSLTGDRSISGAVLTDIGVIAFYIMARLANRLREGQDEALALLVELEASQRAEAEAAALAERQRLAREMHDVLAHSLSGLVLQLEGARLLASREGVDPELAAAVDRSLHLGKAGLEEARRAIGMLRDEELPGPERLPALARDIERDLGVPCSFELSGEERPLGSVARLTVYRVAQEALTNVRRHARRPTSVALRLAYEPDGTRLVVEDVGDAPVDAAIGRNGSGGGYGITGMRERAELLGGRLVAGATEAGFRVELWVPA
jgi:signal transduction histidine kinase